VGVSDRSEQERIEPRLADALAATGDDESAALPILIRLEPSSAQPPPTAPRGPERARALEAQFRNEAAEVLELLERHAADEIALLWISRSIAARASKAAIRALAAIPAVAQIQLVRRFRALADDS
jgi:hypothetical protein